MVLMDSRKKLLKVGRRLGSNKVFRFIQVPSSLYQAFSRVLYIVLHPLVCSLSNGIFSRIYPYVRRLSFISGFGEALSRRESWRRTFFLAPSFLQPFPISSVDRQIVFHPPAQIYLYVLRIEGGRCQIQIMGKHRFPRAPLPLAAIHTCGYRRKKPPFVP